MREIHTALKEQRSFMHLYVSCYCEIKTDVSQYSGCGRDLLALVVIYSTSSPHVITCTNRTPPCLPQYRTECCIKSISVFYQELIFSQQPRSHIGHFGKVFADMLTCSRKELARV